MTLISLLLSRDQQVIGVIRTALQKLAVEVEVCRGARSGCEILSSEKFDAVIVDCDDLQGGLDVFENLRHGESNKNSVTFAILNGKTTTHEAFELGAKFVLQKPISPSSAARCFNAALGFMEREQRRYFRHPVEMATLVISNLGQELKATATNLSEGGMAITFRGKWLKGVVSKFLHSARRTCDRNQSRTGLGGRQRTRRPPLLRIVPKFAAETRTLGLRSLIEPPKPGELRQKPHDCASRTHNRAIPSHNDSR